MVVTAQVFNAMPPWRSTLSTGNYGVGSAWSMLVKTISWAWNGSRGVKVCVLRANKFADNETLLNLKELSNVIKMPNAKETRGLRCVSVCNHYCEGQ